MLPEHTQSLSLSITVRWDVSPTQINGKGKMSSIILTTPHGREIGLDPKGILSSERGVFNKTTKIVMWNGDKHKVKETPAQIKRKQAATKS